MSSRMPLEAKLRFSLLAMLPGILMVTADVSALDDTRKSFISDTSSERIPLVTAFPKYPYVARRDRIQGETVVCFTVSSKGRVERPTVRTSTHRIFRRPAMKAIRASSFEALAPGEAKSFVKSCRTYRFRLDPVLAENIDH
jgi:TonB family protein